MKDRSIRTRVTFWFATSLIIVVLLSVVSFEIVGQKVTEKTIVNILRDAVENNLDEVEYYDQIPGDGLDYDADYYMKYNQGWLEIDDDFIPNVNGVFCTVYDAKSGETEMIYGENPIADTTKNIKFSNRDVQKVNADGITYYIYDRKIKSNGLDDMWIRGVVSYEDNAGDIRTVSQITSVILIIILAVAIIGGYMVAGYMLNPISRISGAASRISRGNDLKERIDIGEGKDEVHELADSFNNMMERLEEAFADEQRFTSDVSHELRTPISVIMTQSEFALDSGKCEEDYVSALKSIKRQADKMSKLVNDMLTFARLGKESSVYVKEKLDFSELVESISEDMALIGENNITLESHVKHGISVSGNKDLLARLIVNLIGNAYKYGREDGHIYVRLDADGDKAYLSVEDDGIGIAEAEIANIFKRMYQVDSSRHDKGSGLGLFMVKEIAQYHDGEVTVESRLGEGSRFVFEVPLLK